VLKVGDGATAWVDLPEVGSSTYVPLSAVPVAHAAVFTASHRSVYIMQNPAAEYDATSNKTFLAYVGLLRKLYVTAYDHATGLWASPVFVLDYPFSNAEDDHGAPSLCIDGSGYIHVVWGAHGSAHYHAVSTSPRSIAAWTTNSTLVTGTYASVTYNAGDGKLYFVHRAGSTDGPSWPAHSFGALAVSSDSGATWIETQIVDTNVYNGDAVKDYYAADCDTFGGKVYFTFIVAHGAAHDGTRSDLFVAYYDPADGHIYTVGGTDLGTGIDSLADLNACKAYTGDWTNAAKFFITAAGTPVVAFQAYDSSGTPTVRTKVARYVGGSWTVVNTGQTSKHLYHGVGIRERRDSAVVEVYTVTRTTASTAIYDPKVQEGITFATMGGDLSRYTSTDLDTWVDAGTVIAGEAVSGPGIGDVGCPRSASDELSVLAQPPGFGVVQVPASTRPGNAPSWEVPIYAAGTGGRPVAPLARPASRRVVYHVGDIYNITSGSGVTPPTSWTDVSLYGKIPYRATALLLRVIIAGDGTAGARAGVEFRRSGVSSAADLDAEVSIRAADTFQMVHDIWVPITPGSTYYQWRQVSGNHVATTGCIVRLMAVQIG